MDFVADLPGLQIGVRPCVGNNGQPNAAALCVIFKIVDGEADPIQ